VIDKSLLNNFQIFVVNFIQMIKECLSLLVFQLQYFFTFSIFSQPYFLTVLSAPRGLQSISLPARRP